LEEIEDNFPPHSFLPDYQISYTDRYGAITDRRITIIRVEGDLIFAYCHLRHAKRSFYISSVNKWTNCSTGEIVKNIFEDIDSERENSVFATIDKMYDELYPAMGVLLYLGKGDKRLVIEERSAMIDVFKALCHDPRLTDEMINNGINEMMVPSKTKFKRLVLELVAMEDNVHALVIDAATRFFASRKKLNVIEQEGMDELRKRLKF
jgi:hypothetical protein